MLEYQLGSLNIKESTEFIMNRYYESNKDEIIIINIGTDRLIGDMFAPMLGSLMELKEIDIKYYGTLEDPIHAINMHSKLDEIYNLHNNPFIIGIDSCIGANINTFIVRDEPISPGEAVQNDLPKVGDVSIFFHNRGRCR